MQAVAAEFCGSAEKFQNSGATGIWYLGWFGGDYYQPGPALYPNVNLGWQLQGGL